MTTYNCYRLHSQVGDTSSHTLVSGGGEEGVVGFVRGQGLVLVVVATLAMNIKSPVLSIVEKKNV